MREKKLNKFTKATSNVAFLFACAIVLSPSIISLQSCSTTNEVISSEIIRSSNLNEIKAASSNKTMKRNTKTSNVRQNKIGFTNNRYIVFTDNIYKMELNSGANIFYYSIDLKITYDLATSIYTSSVLDFKINENLYSVDIYSVIDDECLSSEDNGAFINIEQYLDDGFLYLDNIEINAYTGFNDDYFYLPSSDYFDLSFYFGDTSSVSLSRGYQLTPIYETFDSIEELYSYAEYEGYEEGFNLGVITGEQLGYEQGIDEGYDSGYDVGFGEGEISGYNEGYEVGYQEGYDTGYDNGYDVGYKKGYADGVISGNNVGYQEGYDNGYDVGYENGRSDGYDVGRSDGYTEGKNDGFVQGEELGYSEGYDVGYEEGYNYAFNYSYFGPLTNYPLTYGLWNYDTNEYDYSISTYINDSSVYIDSIQGGFKIKDWSRYEDTDTYGDDYGFSLTIDFGKGVKLDDISKLYPMNNKNVPRLDFGQTIYITTTNGRHDWNGANIPNLQYIDIDEFRKEYLVGDTLITSIQFIGIRADYIPYGLSTNTDYSIGYESGYSTGHTSGVLLGRTEGYEAGFNDGKIASGTSYSDGYTKGYNDAKNQYQNVDALSFEDVLSAVITAPNKIIREGFDFDILGINVGSLIQTCVVIGLIVFSIGLFKKG